MDGDDREDVGPQHPTPEDFARLLSGQLPAGRAAGLVAHLLAGCPSCAATLTTAPGQNGEAYQPSFARARSRAQETMLALGRAREEARAGLGKILEEGRDPGDSADSPHDRWAWCELLIETAAAKRRKDPAGAVELGLMAVLAAGQLEPGPIPAALLADLKARSWGELANLLRAAGDLGPAEEALGKALDRMPQGTGEPLLLARLLGVAGSLWRDQRRFVEATAALEMASRLYAYCGDRHLAGRALVTRGLTQLYAGRPEPALADLGNALALLDPACEPCLALAAIHNCLLAYVDCGRHEAAARLLERARPVYERFGASLDRLRLDWLAARVEAALDRPDRAERLLREVKAGFAEAGLAFDEALAALELAALLLDAGRAAEVLPLVDGMLAVFHQRGVLREVFGTVLVLRRAVERGEATAALARALAEELRRREREAPHA